MSSSDRPTNPVPEPTILDHVAVLMVDDDELAGMLIEEKLPHNLRQLVSIFQVHTLGAAFHHFESGLDCDVVLLDLGLPGSKGRETLSKFKAHAPDVPIVVFTNTVDAEMKSQMETEDVHSYVVKGEVPPKELIANLVLEVGAHRSNRTLKPKEIEVHRIKSRAAVEVSRATSLPPDAPNAEGVLTRATANLQLAQSHEATLLGSKVSGVEATVSQMNSKLDLLLGSVSEVKAENVGQEKDLEHVKKIATDNSDEIDKIKSQAQSEQLAALKAKIDKEKKKTVENTDLAKAKWAAFSAVAAAIVAAATTWLVRG